MEVIIPFQETQDQVHSLTGGLAEKGDPMFKQKRSREFSLKLYETNFANMYDKLYSWEKRYQNEVPFFSAVAKRYNIKRILDAGCGNGFHLCLYKTIEDIERIVGFDNSRLMVRKAKENLANRNITDVKVVTADFRDSSEVLKDKFDLITCIFGVSAIPSGSQIIRTLRHFRKLLTKGGVLMIEDTNGDRIIKHSPRLEYRPQESPSFRIFKRGMVEAEVYEHLSLPLAVSLQLNRRLLLKIALPPLYRWLKRKNLYIKIYHNLDPYLVNDHLFLHSGLLRRADVELFRTRCWLLPKEILEKYLRLAGFSKSVFYSDYRFSPFRTTSYSQIVLAQ